MTQSTDLGNSCLSIAFDVLRTSARCVMPLKEVGCMEVFTNLTIFGSVSPVTNPVLQQLKDQYENILLGYGKGPCMSVICNYASCPSLISRFDLLCSNWSGV